MNDHYFLCHSCCEFLCRELSTEFNLGRASSAGYILPSPFLRLLGKLKSNYIVQQISSELSNQLAEAVMTWKLGCKFLFFFFLNLILSCGIFLGTSFLFEMDGK